MDYLFLNEIYELILLNGDGVHLKPLQMLITPT